MKLRNYQTSAVEAVFEAWQKFKRVLVVLPTGCGKKANVVVSTVQAQCAGPDGAKRMDKFKSEEFAAVIVDEAPSPRGSATPGAVLSAPRGGERNDYERMA